MTSLRQMLVNLRVCREAIDWVGDRDLATAWAECERGDWMLYFAGSQAGPPLSDSRRPLVLAARECSRLASPYAARTPTTGAAFAAAEAADYAAEAACAAASSVRSDDVAFAAGIAAFAAAEAAAYFSVDAAPEDTASAQAIARSAVLRQCADIVRKHYPQPLEPRP